ncbi:MAG: hypothetical protein QOJ46_2163 [bacterium]|jgi:hypothetical protein
MLAYKFTGPGGASVFTGFQWPLPVDGAPGEWVRISDGVDLCVAGIHACRPDQVPHWLGPELWRIELDGDVVESAHKLVAPAGRLVARVEGWPRAERDFAEDCAARVRQLAAGELLAAGFHEDAASTAAAQSVDELGAIAESVAHRAPPLVAQLVGYAVDCYWDIDNSYFAMCAYVAATAFASDATGDTVQDMSSLGWAEERARQAAWLATRLAL